MYASTATLGDAATDEALRLKLFREVYDLNHSIAANKAISPPTPESLRAIGVMLPILKDRLTRLRQVTGVVNASELTAFDRAVVSTGDYLAAAAKAGGRLASGVIQQGLMPLVLAAVVGLAVVNKIKP